MYIPNKLNKIKIEKSNKNIYSTSYRINSDLEVNVRFSSLKYSFRISSYNISNITGNENDIGRYAELPNTASVFNGTAFNATTLFYEDNPTFNFTRSIDDPSFGEQDYYVQIINLNTNETVYKEKCGRVSSLQDYTLP